MSMPGVIVPLVLQHVSLQDRLKHCALVCRSWRREVLAVSSRIDAGVSTDTLTSLFQYVQQQNVTELRLHSKRPLFGAPAPVVLTLSDVPCSKLNNLVISGMELHITPDGHLQPQSSQLEQQDLQVQQQSLQAFTSLQHLQLMRCRIVGGVDALAALTAQLTNLRSLDLEYVHAQDLAQDVDDHLCPPTDSILQLAHLTSLTLYSPGSTLVAQLSALTVLQELCLYYPPALQGGEACWALPQVTKLQLSWAPASAAGDAAAGMAAPSTDSPFAGLTSLKALHLTHCTLEPQALSNLTSLEELTLLNCSCPAVQHLKHLRLAARAAAAGAAVDAAAGAAVDAPSTASLQAADTAVGDFLGLLLSYVGQLQHLTQLAFSIDYDSSIPVPGKALAALSASNRTLVRLDLPAIYWSGAAAWAHVLPPTVPMQQLTFLAVGQPFTNRMFADRKPCQLPPQLPQLIADSCPALQSLLLLGPWRLQLAPLCGLPRLRVLSLAPFGNDGAAQLAGLKRLKQLVIMGELDDDLDHRGLLHLTALQQLTSLTISVMNLGPMIQAAPTCRFANLSLGREQAEGSPPVWQQLLDRCSRCTCRPQTADAGAAEDAGVQKHSRCLVWDRYAQ